MSALQPPSSNPLPPVHFPATPYEADGGCPMSGFGLMMAAAMICGPVFGYIASFIGQYFWLIIIFSCAVGIGLGLVLCFCIHFGKVRNPWLAGLTGLLGGGLAMASMHYFDYRTAMASDADRDPVAHKKLVDDGFGFSDYMDAIAQEGVTLSRTGHGAKGGWNLGYYGSIIYWLVEIGIASVCTFCICLVHADQPFCTICQTWMVEKTLGSLAMSGDHALRIINSGDLHQFFEPAPVEPFDGTVVMKMSQCLQCGQDSPIHVKLEHLTQNEKGEDKEERLVHITYPGAALPVMDSIFQIETPAT